MVVFQDLLRSTLISYSVIIVDNQYQTPEWEII